MDRTTVSTADEAREKAIAWQSWVSEQSLSMGETAEWGTYFEDLADKFPELREEFEENAIIGRDLCPRCGGDHDRVDRRDPCPEKHAHRYLPEIDGASQPTGVESCSCGDWRVIKEENDNGTN